MSFPVIDSYPLYSLHVSETIYWQKYYELSDIAYEWNEGQLKATSPRSRS